MSIYSLKLQCFVKMVILMQVLSVSLTVKAMGSREFFSTQPAQSQYSFLSSLKAWCKNAHNKTKEWATSSQSAQNTPSSISDTVEWCVDITRLNISDMGQDDTTLFSHSNSSSRTKVPNLINNYLKKRSLGFEKRGIKKSQEKIVQKKGTQTSLEVYFDDLAKTDTSVDLTTISKLVLKSRNNAFQITQEYMQLLALRFPALRILSLENSGFDTNSFQLLAESRIAPQLLELIINLSEPASISLTTELINKFTSLQNLSMVHVVIQDAGFNAIATSQIAPTIRVLVLRNSGLTSAKCITAVLDKFTNLQVLDITGNIIQDGGFQSLAESQVAGNLYELYISATGMTDAAFTSERFDRFKRLEKLEISDTRITGPDRSALENSAIHKRFDKFKIESPPTTFTFKLCWHKKC